jgi:TatD DNase family protein
MWTMWIDTHCHLELPDFSHAPTPGPDPNPEQEPALVDERPDVLARARAAGISRLIVIGSGHGLAEVDNAVALARQHAQLFAAIGVHPHDATIIEAPDAASPESSPGPRGRALWDHIERLAATEPRVVAVGETGLDYYYKNAPAEHQQALLRRFVRLSAATGKPLSLHIRDAHADAQRIVTEEGGAVAGGVIHCFTGGPAEAESWLALGFHISLSGIVTFKSAAAIQAAARLVPADRLLLETDCPYLAPVPLRGQRNEPAYLVHTAAFVARLRDTPPATLAATSSAAAERLFKLPPMATAA